jgi:hypothetical protein
LCLTQDENQSQTNTKYLGFSQVVLINASITASKSIRSLDMNSSQKMTETWYIRSHLSFLKLHLGRSTSSISDSSSTGYENNECAVTAPSKINAARLVEAQSDIRIP